MFTLEILGEGEVAVGGESLRLVCVIFSQLECEEGDGQRLGVNENLRERRDWVSEVRASTRPGARQWPSTKLDYGTGDNMRGEEIR